MCWTPTNGKPYLSFSPRLLIFSCLRLACPTPRLVPHFLSLPHAITYFPPPSYRSSYFLQLSAWPAQPFQLRGRRTSSRWPPPGSAARNASLGLESAWPWSWSCWLPFPYWSTPPRQEGPEEGAHITRCLGAARWCVTLSPPHRESWQLSHLSPQTSQTAGANRGTEGALDFLDLQVLKGPPESPASLAHLVHQGLDPMATAHPSIVPKSPSTQASGNNTKGVKYWSLMT